MKPKNIWFKKKSYGWGWTPVSIEGWFAMLIYVLGLLKLFSDVDMKSHSTSDTLINFAPRFVIITLALIALCYFTGEKPTWSWGDKAKS